jgi:hypothetical protein
MRRRDFMQKTLAYGAAAGTTLGSALVEGAEPATIGADTDPLVERVRTAMLTMQRQAWEQGVASQALLEWGDRDLVILMAKEAVIRIYDDGRLGQVCDNHGVTDPGSNGEPVLYAAKLTGDPSLPRGRRSARGGPETDRRVPQAPLEQGQEALLSYLG